MGRRADLSPEKQALLDKWVRDGAGAGPRITPRLRGDGPMPLSFVQERQLFLELLDPGTAINNLVVCTQIDGALDLATLEQSLNCILARHEALRTSFGTQKGKPVAEVAPTLRIDLGIVNLEAQETGRQAEALRLAEVEARRPFDLTHAPLLRVTTFRLAPEEHVFLLVIHHTIADGWSLGVFLRELASSYEAIRAGRPVPLAPLPIQYGDYAHWQRQSMSGPRFEQQLRFWKEQLAGELPVLELPLDHARPARQTLRGGTHRFRVPTGLTDRVKESSRLQDVTLFMTLVAAFQTLLHRYGANDDVLLGTPIAGRTRPEVEELIGVFINTVVLRTDLSGDPSFYELLQRVRRVALAAYGHQDLPFEKLVAELRPQRDLSRPPIFQAMFILQNTPIALMAIPGLSVQPVTIDTGATQFDLTLIVTPSDEGLDAAFEYNADLFDAPTIERLGGAFRRILEDAVARPETRLSGLTVLSEAERHRVLFEWNDTTAPYPRGTRVHELFEAQVERTPQGLAAVAGGARVTYLDLDRRARRIARDLRALGVGPGDRVAVRMERSPALLAGLLAVLEVGAAYVPMDPSLPAERVEFMRKDSNARLLLTQESLKPSEASYAVVVAPVDGAALDDERRSPADAHPLTTPEQPAYVIYTSGSTGQPKGVVVPHGALVNLLWSMREALGLQAGDAFLAVTSVSFDIAALEMFLPLIVGATVVLAGPELTRDGRGLEEAIETHGVTMIQATPAIWRMMLRSGWRGDKRLVALCGGDMLTPDLAVRLLDRVGTLWNLYGPTETTVWSAAGRVRSADDPITIGRPIANTRLYVLDDRLQPVPVGAIGELHIGGDGVALGYLDRPELTAEKFAPDPFVAPAREGGRLFKTGDRARHRSDGSIELLGRRDDQVKIHGVRIELGEVAAALRRHPSVRDAVVVARDGAAGEKSMVAFFVPEREPPPTPAELRGFLRTMLPGCMVPPVFASLPELPLTPAGKVDRRSLPAASTAAADSAFIAPRTRSEEILAEIYAQVLGVDRVGSDDNLFDLGGGSIQILEIIVRAHAFDVALAPDWFFECQTVAEMASFLGARPEALPVGLCGSEPRRDAPDAGPGLRRGGGVAT